MAPSLAMLHLRLSLALPAHQALLDQLELREIQVHQVLQATAAVPDLKDHQANPATTALQEKREHQVTTALLELQANQATTVRRVPLATMALLAFLEVLDYPEKTVILAALDPLDPREKLDHQATLFHPRFPAPLAHLVTTAKTELQASQAVPAQLDRSDL